MQRGENAAINDKRHIVGCTLREPNLPVRAPHASIIRGVRAFTLFPFANPRVSVYIYTCLSLSPSLCRQRDSKER